MGIDLHLYEKKENNFRYKSNSKGLVFNNLIFTEENGFRAPNNNFKYDKKNSIIFFGDSVTFGNGVDEDKTFVGLLRKKHQNYNFYNISLPGYQIDNHINNFVYLDKFENISKIIYVPTLNDIDIKNNIEIISKNNTEINKNYIQKLKNISFINKANIWLRNKSYLYMFIKGLFSDPSKRWFQYDYELYKDERKINSFKELLDNLKNKNIDIFIIFLPYEYQTRSKNCNKEIIQMPQLKLEAIAKEYNTTYLNLTKNFCSFQNSKKLFYKFDPMHLSENGHALVFDAIDNALFN